jgi:hypothetical protein
MQIIEIGWDGFNSDERTGGTEKRRKSAMTHFLRRAQVVCNYIHKSHIGAPGQKSDAALAKHCNYTRAAATFFASINITAGTAQKKLMNQQFFA